MMPGFCAAPQAKVTIIPNFWVLLVAAAISLQLGGGRRPAPRAASQRRPAGEGAAADAAKKAPAGKAKAN